MPFLALDAGNSSVKAAVWSGGRWGETARWPSASRDVGVWAGRLAALPGASGAGIASVVPALTPGLVAAVEAALGVEPVVVSAALPLPFRLAYRTPETLGADRLAAAVAAWTLAGGPARPVVALDAGTAITTDAVAPTPDGPVYLGGAILPGPDLLRRALARDTGALPDVPWADAGPIGASTAEAVQAGLSALVLDGVAGLLRRTAGALGAEPVVVATGGWAPWLAERIDGIDHVAPTLVLDGVRQLAEGRGGRGRERR